MPPWEASQVKLTQMRTTGSALNWSTFLRKRDIRSNLFKSLFEIKLLYCTSTAHFARNIIFFQNRTFEIPTLREAKRLQKCHNHKKQRHSYTLLLLKSVRNCFKSFKNAMSCRSASRNGALEPPIFSRIVQIHHRRSFVRSSIYNIYSLIGLNVTVCLFSFF